MNRSNVALKMLRRKEFHQQHGIYSLWVVDSRLWVVKIWPNE